MWMPRHLSASPPPYGAPVQPRQLNSPPFWSYVKAEGLIKTPRLHVVLISTRQAARSSPAGTEGGRRTVEQAPDRGNHRVDLVDDYRQGKGLLPHHQLLREHAHQASPPPPHPHPPGSIAPRPPSPPPPGPPTA